MHQAAFEWIARIATATGPVARVIEIGSRDINGTVRNLFDAGEYVGVDIEAGPGVDVVADASRWQPDRRADLVVCAEVLEHVPNWDQMLSNTRHWLNPGGRLVLTCAGPGRRPHSGIDGRRRLHPGEHYGNVDPHDLSSALAATGYDRVNVEQSGADVRAVAHRPDIATWALIPFRDEWRRTRLLVNQLIADPAVDRVLLADNGSTDPGTLAWLGRLRDPKVLVDPRPPLGPGRSLYAVWNEMAATATADHPGPVNIAVLNNDLTVPPGIIGHLARALRAAPPHVAAVYPDWRRPITAGTAITGITETRGAWRAGGLSGFCFMFRGEELRTGALPWFDTRYEWIFGDGDWVEALEQNGRAAARVDGLPLEHDRSATARHTSWVAAAKARDVERRREKVAAR